MTVSTYNMMMLQLKEQTGNTEILFWRECRKHRFLLRKKKQKLLTNESTDDDGGNISGSFGVRMCTVETTLEFRMEYT